MKVSKSESQLLQLTRSLVDGSDVLLVTPLMADSGPEIAKIGPTAMGVLKQTLSHGLIRHIVHGGGARNEARPVDGDLRTGRLWERHPTPEIRFSPWSFRLLKTLLHEPVLTAGMSVPGLPQSNGDHFLAFSTASRLIEASLPRGLPTLAQSPLVQLGFPWFVRECTVDWRPFLEAHAWMVEGLSAELTEAWVVAERAKMRARQPGSVEKRSKRQRAVLEPLLDALEAMERADLAEFLLDAARQLIPQSAAPPPLGATQLDDTRTLRERAAARAASTAFLDALIRLETWHHADRGVRFFEDDYDASQARLQRWEAYGDGRARAVCDLREALVR